MRKEKVMGFTKLFSSITESSIWCESDKTLRIWVAMLARKNAFGFVEGSIPGMANLCRMTVEEFQKAIKPLLEPDPFSRNPIEEGRRLKSEPGGWFVVNHEAYRDRQQDQEGSRAEYYRKYRAEKKNIAPQHKSVVRNKVQHEVQQKELRDTQIQITDTDKDFNKDLTGSLLKEPEEKTQTTTTPFQKEKTEEEKNQIQDAEEFKKFTQRLQTLHSKLMSLCPNFPWAKIRGNYIQQNKLAFLDSLSQTIENCNSKEPMVLEAYFVKVFEHKNTSYNASDYQKSHTKFFGSGPRDPQPITSIILNLLPKTTNSGALNSKKQNPPENLPPPGVQKKGNPFA